jgi:hypothetical protein
MTHSEQEEILRRALHAVADTIEPAPDGLERIRERLSRPRPLAVAWLMAGWTVLAQPVLFRMEPILAEVDGRLSARLGAWLRLLTRSLGAAAERLRPAAERLRPAIERLGPASERLGPAAERLLAAVKRLRPGPGMSRHEKLRSAIAFGAAALIGTAGGFALSAGLPQQVFSAATSLISPSKSNPAPRGGHNSGVSGSGQPIPGASSAAPRRTRRPSPTSTPACTPKPRASASPTPSSPSPTQTSPSPTPSSPSPTQTSPSPTPNSSSPSPTQNSGGIPSPSAS